MGGSRCSRDLFGLILSWGALLQPPPAMGQSVRSPEIQEYMRRRLIIRDVMDRAHEVKPRRRDEPLRDINISDEEIREIQVLVRDVLPRAIVNIGPVVKGCPCEEGIGCTEQVYIQANSSTNSVGLLLSRSLNRWSISAAQKWWLRWNAFEKDEGALTWAEREEREWQLIQDFPVCTRDARKAENGVVPSAAEPRK